MPRACFMQTADAGPRGDHSLMTEANAGDSHKSAAKKKKAKSTPKKERQISLRLSPKVAKRLTRLTEIKEWTVTQVIEESLKFYAAQEGIAIEDKPAEPSEPER